MIAMSGLAALVLLTLTASIQAADQTLTGAEGAAARDGIQEALDSVVLSATKFLQDNNRDSLSLPPSLYEEERRWAGFVKVSLKHNYNNMTLSKFGTVRRAGLIGVDPLSADGNTSFTIPLELDEPHLTGEFVYKFTGVGPSGEFNATIGEYKLEAEGTATVTRNACSVHFNSVRETVIGKVDTQMHGATVFLNAPLAPLVTSDISKGKMGFQNKVNEALLQVLQEQAAKLDCNPIIQRHIRNT